MNKINTIVKKTGFRLRISFIISILGAITFLSCSKEDKKVILPDGSTKISVSIGSITSEDVTTPKGKSMSASTFMKTGETILKKEVVKRGEDIEIDITTAIGKDLSFGENTPYRAINRANRPAIAKQMSRSGIAPLAADIPMEVGVKYWLVLYNKASQQFEHSLQATSGTKVELDVVKNQEYEWYAYSYDSEDNIPPLNANNPEIETKIDKPFLYARGTITATETGSTPLVIVFKHQLQQVKIRIDTRGVFGNITSLLAKFAQNTNIKTTAFNIKTGNMTGSLNTAPISNLIFTNVESDSDRQLEARYYTAELSNRTYTIDVDQLAVILPNGASESLPVQDLSVQERTFSFTTGGKGKVHYVKVEVYKVIPTKKILHIEGNSVYSYAASNPAKASGAFLRDVRNFSSVSPYVRVRGFEHDVQTSGANKLRNALANPATWPDIIIAGMFSGFTQADYDILELYVRRGGVVFLMIENANLGRPEVFFQRIFNSQAVTMKLYDISGSIYKLNNVDSDVLGWPFDDTRGKYWGQDGSSTFYIENIPAGEKENIFIYSESSVNRNNQQPGSVSMFRHKTFNLFYVGDTGFLSNEKQWGQYTSYTIEPYATNEQNFPVPHTAYGRAAQSNSPEAGTPDRGWHVHNSAIFGNVFAYLIAQAHYMELDRSPIQ
ncbi:hypothetical protein ORI89_02955 [Sphingobacterium sp. UT-1RO-CII-1]|uniref:hypothetical protein n=1 Tax=Sphingobacterium sp. UT-1RO-CII-1 TaxID=2995225 RepID=UPI00227BEF29|nr:hypothetical protein [Sphingobacterium sp. UT-1RO-CII-1]MCY4778595.1 hypothetical protein [Sphingobacterium sp. UT-1RO-CII-1]